jgi:hypothetical protein
VLAGVEREEWKRDGKTVGKQQGRWEITTVGKRKSREPWGRLPASHAIDRGQKTEDRRQRTEDRGQKTEDRRQ